MARISSYGQDGTLNKLDKVLGTDSITGDTKNYTINSMLQLVNQEGLVEAFDGASFAFVDYIASADNPRGVINLNAGVASPANFSDINEIYISTVDKTGLSIVEYLENSLNNQIKVSLKGNMNQFGIYEVTAIADHDSGAYKRLTLTPRAHNGILTVQDDFFLSNYSAVFDQDFSNNSVTEFSDVHHAGSGRIITNEERTSLTNFTNNGLVHGDVVDNVTSTDATVPLSANQGKILKGLINNINTLLTSDNVSLDTLQEVVDFIEANRESLNTLAISNIAGLQNALNAKQNAEAGKGLSANDFTDVLLNKLNNISANAEVNVNADWNATTGDAEILNKPTDVTDLAQHSVTELNNVTSAGSGAIISGAERTKLTNINVNITNRTVTDGTTSIVVPPANAEQNVNADWDATTGDAQILNKPALAPSNAEPNVQVDWSETDTASNTFILNKPTLAPSNAEQNVQVDWSESDTASDAFILNKPDVSITKAKVDTALGTGPADDTYFYRGDGTWALPSTAIAIGDLTDVDGSTTNPGINQGHVLRWNPTLNKWIGASLSLENLYNVNPNSSNSVGKVFAVTSFNAQNSVNSYNAVELDLSYLSDFNVTSPANNQILQYDSANSEFINKTDVVLPGTLEFGSIQATTPSFDNGIYVSTQDGHDVMHFRYHGHDLSIDYLTQVLPTGILNGGVLSKANNTQFTIAAGDGIINDLNKGANTDPHPEIIKVSWTEQTITVSNLDANDTEQLNSWIYVDSAGTVQQQSTAFTDAQKKSNIIIGSAIHSEGVVKFVKTFPHTGYNNASQMNEFAGIFGPMKKSGHKITANGANLSIDRAAGVSFALGRNYANDPENPSTVSDAAKTQCVIHRYYGDGSGGFVLDDGVTGAGYATLDPGNYDDGSGTLASVSGGHYTVQRLFYFPGTPNIIVAYYGRDEYNSIDTAEKSYNLEDFIEAPNTSDQAIYVGAVIMAGATTDLTDTSDTKFLTAGAFRGLAAVTVGGAIAGSALNDISDVSIQNVSNSEVLRYNSSTQQWENVSNSILPITLDTVNNRVGINDTTPTATLDITNDDTTDASKVLNVKDDSSNSLLLVQNDGNVGIGTDSPSSSFGDTTLDITNSTGDASLSLKALSNRGFEISSRAGDVLLYDLHGRAIRFGSGNSEKMRITSSGNVGIGTNSPSNTLHVNSGSTNEVAKFESTDGAAYISLKDSTTTHGLQGIGSIGDALVMYSNNGERMRINSAGNVRIGTTSAGGNLHIYEGASGQSTPNASASSLILEDNANNGLSILTPNTGIGSIFFGDNDDNFVGGFRYDHSDNSLDVNVNNALAVAIDSSRNVGIGTDSPSSALEVANDDRANGAVLSITNSAHSSNWIAGDVIGSIDFKISDSSTTEPVRGQIEVIDALGTGSSTYPYANDMIFKTANLNSISERMRINSSGNVGIGTDSPSAKLELKQPQGVSGAFYQPSLLLSNSSQTDNGGLTSIAMSTSTAPNYGYALSTVRGAAGGTSDFVITHHDNSLTGNERMRITSTGRVGIGTTNPVQKLQVDGSIYSNGGEFFVNNNKGITAVGNLIFKANDGTSYFEGMRLASTGNVGIGTTSPSVTLDVNSTDAIAFPTGTTAQRPSSPAAGMLRYNTTDGQFEGYTTEWGAIAGSGGGASNITRTSFSGDDSTTQFSLSENIADEANTQIYISGVYQEKTTYSVSGQQITFSEAPPEGTNNIEVIHIASVTVDGASGITRNTYTGTGSQQSFTLSVTPSSEDFTFVYVDGVYADKNEYTLNNNVITFVSAPANNASVEVMTINAVNIQQTSYLANDTFTGDDSTTTFTLVNGQPSNEAFTMVFVQGVYQNKNTYSLSSNSIVFTEAPYTGDSIEVISINGGGVKTLPPTTADDIRYNVEVINTNTTAQAGYVYVFTGNLTLTLPALPKIGQSIKISNRSGVDTCVLGAGGNKIMGDTADLTLDTASASFELIYSGNDEGWVIIGQ